MKLSDILSKSCYCSSGHIDKESDLEDIYGRLQHNFEVINSFPKIVTINTKTQNCSEETLDKCNKLWTDLFGSKCITIKDKNYGKNFGPIYLDNRCVEEGKKFSDVKYIWKSAFDVLIDRRIFDFEIEKNDELFYIESMGWAGMKYFNMNVELALSSMTFNRDWKYFFPQTWFFIVDSRVDYLIKQEELDAIVAKSKADPRYKIDPIETDKQYFLNEDNLKKCIFRNNLKCKHLVKKETFEALLNLVVKRPIVDSSFKNVYFSEIGLCHFQFVKDEVIEL